MTTRPGFKMFAIYVLYDGGWQSAGKVRPGENISAAAKRAALTHPEACVLVYGGAPHVTAEATQ
jgi:hypothetical protein